MFKSSVSKVYFSYLFILIGIFVISFVVLHNFIARDTKANLYQTLLKEAHLVGNNFQLLDSPEQNARTFLENYPTNHSIILSDRENRVIARNSSDYPLDEKIMNHVLAGNIKTYQAKDNRQAALLVVSTPLYTKQGIVGAITVYTPRSLIVQETNRLTMPITIGIGTIIIITILSSHFLSRTIYTVFNSFKIAAQQIAGGNFSARVVDRNFSNEASNLSTNFNYMAGKLEDFETQRNAFIANVSHDFRSPLTSIRGYAQAMSDGTIPPHKQARYLQVIIDETDRLTKLTNDILLLSTMEDNVYALSWEDFNLNEAIRNLLLPFDQKLLDKKIKLHFLPCKEDLIVHADFAQISRVFINLMDNAIKFCRSGDEIEVTSAFNKSKAIVSIRDTGPGISEKELTSIWSRFHKADTSRGQDKAGIGLGLSIVREIIKAHDETIEVYSQLGKGTTFVFTLKRSASPK